MDTKSEILFFLFKMAYSRQSETLFFLFQMPYSSRLMHAMSHMARKGGTIGALHYFDLTQKDAVSLVFLDDECRKISIPKYLS